MYPSLPILTDCAIRIELFSEKMIEVELVVQTGQAVHIGYKFRFFHLDDTTDQGFDEHTEDLRLGDKIKCSVLNSFNGFILDHLIREDDNLGMRMAGFDTLEQVHACRFTGPG